MYPNFIIAGAEKSGTTSLSFYLSEHPDIYIPRVKELHFFENANNYSKGLGWYEKQFAGCKGEKAVGECTPFYMYDDTCAEKIKKAFPEIKILFILRNPVDRAYSNYWHQVRGGKEFLPFEAALEREQRRIKKSRFHSLTYSYLDKGFYSIQIKRFFDLFDSKQLCIVIFEEFKKHPDKVLNQIYDFLGVDAINHQDAVVSSIKNKSIVPRSVYMQFFARKVLKTSAAFRAVAKINLKFGYIDYPGMKKATRNMLNNKYLNDIKQLENMTHKSFQSWLRTE